MKVKTKQELKNLLKDSEDMIASFAHIVRNFQTADFNDTVNLLNRSDTFRAVVKEAIK